MLPADPTLSVAERVDAACDHFESEWKADRKPRIDEFVAAAPESDREELRQALLALQLELQGRSEADTSVSRSSVRSEGKPAADVTVDQIQNVEPPVGKVGRFELRGVLGSGAFGKVYRAFDPQLSREVAIKVPLETTVRTDKERNLFLKEARSAANINHPNICQVHEVGEADGRPYIVMALVRGQSLADTLKGRKEPLPEKQVALVVRKIALALAAAHDSGIVHRDLKPANVMFDRERKDIVVMDFGLARGPKLSDARGTQSGVIMGTPAYMSPEQARGDSKGVGPAGDVFSLGVILYELLTGTRPFTGTATEVIGKILHVEPEKPSAVRPGVDSRLEAICLKAMAKDTAARFASMKEVAAALDIVLRKPTPTGPAVETAKVNTTRRQGEEEGTSTRNNLAEVFAVLSDDRKQARVETAAAVEAAIAKHRTPRWVFLLVGLFALGGFTALAGIVFFTRSDAMKVDLTVVLKDVDLADKSLTFFLNEEPISPDSLAKPVELKPGVHIFTVKRGKEIVKRVEIRVEGGRNPGIKVEDITPPTVVLQEPQTPKKPVWMPLIKSADELIDGETRSENDGNRSVNYVGGNLILRGAKAYFRPKFTGKNYIVRAELMSVTDSVFFNLRCKPGTFGGYQAFFASPAQRNHDWSLYGLGKQHVGQKWEGFRGTLQQVADNYPAEVAVACYGNEISIYVNGERVQRVVDIDCDEGSISIGCYKEFKAVLRDLCICVLDGTKFTPDDLFPQKADPEVMRILSPEFLTPELKKQNLLTNGSFEDGTNGWRFESWRNQRHRSNVVATQVHTGKGALEIDNPEADSVGFLQAVDIKQNHRYLLSGWVRTKGIQFHELNRDGAGIQVCARYRHRTPDVPADADWTYFAVIYHSGKNTRLEVAARLGGFAGTVSGTAWYDDLSLIEIPDPLPPTEKKAADDGFVPLFNGKDFTGWKRADEAPNLRGWAIRDGAIARDKASDLANDGYTNSIWTQKPFGDFILEAEITGSGNSGIFFRNSDLTKRPIVGGLEMQINLPPSSKDPWQTGSIWGRQSPSKRNEKAGEWNTVRITARASSIMVEINGEVVNRLDCDAMTEPVRLAGQPELPPLRDMPRNGFIGLQAHAGDVSFRNIRIKELKDDGFVSLFNGKDLTGWKTHPDQPGGWTVEDGYLTGRSDSANHLFSDSANYGDFLLRAECRTNRFGNSGIYFRTEPEMKVRGGKNVFWPVGYEAQIAHEFPKPVQALTGSIRTTGRILAPVDKCDVKPDVWFTLEVVARGKKLIVKVDGVETANIEDGEFSRGHIVLQACRDSVAQTDTVVQFRKIEIKDLGFVPLFNGKDLTGWKTHESQPGNWKVVDGAIVCGSDGTGPTHLYSVRDDYKDFHFRMDVRVKDGSTGAMYRAPFGPTLGANKNWVAGYNAKFDATRQGGIIVDMDQTLHRLRQVEYSGPRD